MGQQQWKTQNIPQTGCHDNTTFDTPAWSELRVLIVKVKIVIANLGNQSRLLNTYYLTFSWKTISAFTENVFIFERK